MLHVDGMIGDADFERAVVLADRVARMLFRLCQRVDGSGTRSSDTPT
jgi:hypothetical protein